MLKLPAQPEELSHLVWLSVNKDYEKVSNGVLSRSRYIDQYTIYTSSLYVATEIEVTHDILYNCLIAN